MRTCSAQGLVESRNHKERFAPIQPQSLDPQVAVQIRNPLVSQILGSPVVANPLTLQMTDWSVSHVLTLYPAEGGLGTQPLTVAFITISTHMN